MNFAISGAKGGLAPHGADGQATSPLLPIRSHQDGSSDIVAETFNLGCSRAQDKIELLDVHHLCKKGSQRERRLEEDCGQATVHEKL